MKRTIIAAALAAVAVTAFAATDDAYRTNAGESDQNTVVRQQLGDAGSYRSNAGEQDQATIQLGDAGSYRSNAGEQDSATVQLG